MKNYLVICYEVTPDKWSAQDPAASEGEVGNFLNGQNVPVRMISLVHHEIPDLELLVIKHEACS